MPYSQCSESIAMSSPSEMFENGDTVIVTHDGKFKHVTMAVKHGFSPNVQFDTFYYQTLSLNMMTGKVVLYRTGEEVVGYDVLSLKDANHPVVIEYQLRNEFRKIKAQLLELIEESTFNNLKALQEMLSVFKKHA